MRWMWIDRIVELQPRQRAVAIKNVTLAEEHLHDHFPATHARPAMPIVPASLIIEGFAQTAGILVGHANDFREKVILAKVSKAELLADVTPGHTIRFTANITHLDAAGASTLGTIERLDPARPELPPVHLGSIEMMFSHIDQNMAGTAFPSHNFVFGDQFKTLLRSSGIPFPD